MEQAITTLFDEARGPRLPLSKRLAARYGGGISFPPAPAGRPYIVGNFVSSIDGVVTFLTPGRTSGGYISDFNKDDEFIMGLLRSCADAVLIGAGTLMTGSGSPNVPAKIAPRWAREYAALRTRLGKAREPLNVVLTLHGDIDIDRPFFEYPNLKTLVVTTTAGKKNLERRYGERLRKTQVESLGARVSPRAVAALLRARYGVKLLLHEGGPIVFGAFLKQGLIDELFLTVAPQIVGRSRAAPRPGFADEAPFKTHTAPWHRLASLKKAGDHLFLRYARKS